MPKHIQRPEDSIAAMARAALYLEQIAADPRLPPKVRTGAAELEATLESLMTKAEERWQAVVSILEDFTSEWEAEDIKWIELRQRGTGQPILKVVEQRFAHTAARALRKAAGREMHNRDYRIAAHKVAAGEWHYLDLIPYLRCAPNDLKMGAERACALERSERRLRSLYRYQQDREGCDWHAVS